MSNNILNQQSYREFFNRVPNPILIGYGGSISYGTNTPESDIDLRGVYLNTKDELLGMAQDKEQMVDTQTDTVMYSLKKMTSLLCACNPNAIEILGLKSEHYLKVSEEAQILLDNKKLFITKKAIKTFGGYAKAQLNRLVNRSGRAKEEITQNEERSTQKSIMTLQNQYGKDKCQIDTYIKDNELYLNMNLTDLNIKEVAHVLNEVNTTHRNYSKSERNTKATNHNKLNKHMMHLLRLYMMGIDLLEKGEIITYREDEHNLLMAIRNNEYLENDLKTPTAEFNKLLEEYTNRFDKACENSKLPEAPNYELVNNLIKTINYMWV